MGASVALVPGPAAGRSPADPFWARVEEADPVQLAEHLAEHLAGLDAATQTAIMRDNGMALVGLA